MPRAHLVLPLLALLAAMLAGTGIAARLATAELSSMASFQQ
jgi:hypothetical protein